MVLSGKSGGIGGRLADAAVDNPAAGSVAVNDPNAVGLLGPETSESSCRVVYGSQED